jgi:hypothetical protein
MARGYFIKRTLAGINSGKCNNKVVTLKLAHVCAPYRAEFDNFIQTARGIVNAGILPSLRLFSS